MMSVHMEQAADAILQAAREASLDELSEVDVDGDGSSSLSDIEDKDPDQDEEAEGSDDLTNPSDDENDSEAETERLEESPNKFRAHQDVVLSSHNENGNENGDEPYEHSPSKLQHQITGEDLEDEEDDDPLSDEDISLNESPGSLKSSVHEDAECEAATAPTSLGDSAGEGKSLLLVADADTRKRKRSIMAGSGLDDDLNEPLRKRTGSVMTPGDNYTLEDGINEEAEVDPSNPVSGNISGDEGGALHDEEIHDEVEEPIVAEEEAPAVADIPASPKRRGRKKKKVVENGIFIHEDPDAAVDAAVLNGDEAPNGVDNAGNEGDDEAAQKNEEEQEKKRIALDQLGAIERQFSTFRDRLYNERLEQLNREEAMLKQSKPTHPEYLAMMQCIDARRNERIRVGDKMREYEFETLKNFAVAKRSQILVQYQQEVRDTREKKLEQLGKQWYEIQHDRRSYAGSVPDYVLKFPTRRSQQVMNQVAYSNEVSILSGIAKYVGFPAAPPMASATAAELEEDFEKMGRTKQVQQAPPAALPLHELVALRSAGSTSRFKPAVEQFIEQTPWANPQHPSHAHLLQRQTSAQQTPRTTSPFSQVQAQPRRLSYQHGGPISGTFSNTPSLQHTSNGLAVAGGRISPHNPFTNAHSHTIAPSPLGSRQTSLSPQQSRPLPTIPDQQHNLPTSQDVPKTNGNQHSPQAGIPRDFPQEARREQSTAIMGQF